MALPNKIWTVAEAKARLSEVLRLADAEGPQRIGSRRTFVVVSEERWRKVAGDEDAAEPMGRWLLENVPRGMELPIPPRTGREREIPFVAEDDA